MTPEPNTIPDDQIRSALKRWQNLEEEKARISDEADMGQYIAYDPATGSFISIKQRRRCKVGDILGSLSDDGYVRITFRRRHYLAHRIAWFLMTGAWPVDKIDHRDLDRSNNRWENLREASQSQNCGNAPLTKRNTSGYKGVSFNKRVGRYQAYIGIGGRQKNLGYFDNPERAHAEYLRAASDHFGEFARSA